MDSYELTDRGKIVIAVVVAVILLLLPSAILLYKTVTSPPSQPTGTPNSEATGEPPPTLAEPTSPEIKDSPPPNGGGLYPSDNPPSNGGDNPDGQSPIPSPDQGHSSVDPVGGTLSFSFFPDRQTTLNRETTSMLDTFLSSPNNTQDSFIIIEIPRVSDEDVEKLMAAVVSAFAAQGVGEQRLTFSTRPSDVSGGAIDVNLYYVAHQGK